MHLYTILLIDDEIQVVEALKRGLRKQPYEVVSAGSPAQALEILSQFERFTLWTAVKT
jgi:CheY-like chemotaxis protein